MSFPNPDTLLVFDGDLILYRIGFGAEDVDLASYIDHRVDTFLQRIQKKFETYNTVIYLTGQSNFRDEIAVSHKYKDRPSLKPKWYPYIRDYLIHCHQARVVHGYEADDAIAMNLTRNPNSIHVGIDKDLLQVEGWHYRYKTHNSPEVALRYVTHRGYLKLTHGKRKRLEGCGYPWFYAQLLMGDRTDSIYGPKGYGDVKTYNTLKECETEKEFYDMALAVYEQHFDNPVARLQENANLLWMVREIDENGELVLWQPPE